MSAKEPSKIFDDGKHPNFALTVMELTDYFAAVYVEEVTEWSCDDSNTPLDTQRLFDATIKWDGCANIDWTAGSTMHLCGARDFKRHCRMLEWVYRETSKLIKDFDPEQKWEAQNP